MTWPRLRWCWDRDLFLCHMSAPGRQRRVRIPYVVRGETRPQSWIILIYDSVETVEKEKKRKVETEWGKKRRFWMTSWEKKAKTEKVQKLPIKLTSKVKRSPYSTNHLLTFGHRGAPTRDVPTFDLAALHHNNRNLTPTSLMSSGAVLCFFSTSKAWSLVLHWSADSTEIKYTLGCKNKTKKKR